MKSKWSKKFWRNLGERVGTTAIYGAIAVLTTSVSEVNAALVWTVVGLPTCLAFLKGLAGNMKNGTADEPTASLIRLNRKKT